MTSSSSHPTPFYTPAPASPRSAHHAQHQFQARLPALHHDPHAGGNEGDMYYAGAPAAPPQPAPPVHSAPTFALPRMAAHQYSAAPAHAAPGLYQTEEGYQEEQETPAYTSYALASPTYTHASLYTASPSLPASYVHTPTHTAAAAAAASTSASTAHAQSQSYPAAPTTQAPAGHPSPTLAAARRHTTRAIGAPLTFATGPFAGRTVRAEIVEVQKADLGRKCADPPTTTTTAPAPASAPASASASVSAPTSAGAAHPAASPDSDKGKSPETPAAARAVRKDRRPLDPPPVVALRYFERVGAGTPQEHEREVPAEDVEIGGLICQVDLFRVTIPPSPTELADLGLQQQGVPYTHPHPHPQQQQQGQEAYVPYAYPNAHAQPHTLALYTDADERRRRRESMLQAEQHADAVSPVSPVGSYGGYGQQQREEAGWDSGASPVSPVSPYSACSSSNDGRYSRFSSAATHAYPSQAYASSAHGYPAHGSYTTHTHAQAPQLTRIDPDALPPPTEADKLTRVLFGEYYSHAASILDLTGKNVIYFVFSDLSVKLEGLFRPRYRFFDLFSRTAGADDVPVLAQCFGGAFAVYSTKEFPGLKASTELTKHLSRWGIRVNIRETERKRRGGGSGGGGGGGGGDRSTPSSAGGGGGGGGRSRGSAAKRGGRAAGGGRTSLTNTGAGARRAGGDAEHDGSSGTSVGSPPGAGPLPRGVDAPRRYLEGAAAAAAAAASGSVARGRGRGKKRGKA